MGLAKAAASLGAIHSWAAVVAAQIKTARNTAQAGCVLVNRMIRIGFFSLYYFRNAIFF
jgi:hypothetical protein